MQGWNWHGFIKKSEYAIFDKVALTNVYALQIEFHRGVQRLPDHFRSEGFKVTSQGDHNGLGYLRALKE